MISNPVERWKLRLGESTWKTYEPKWNTFLRIMKIADPKELLVMSQQDASDLAVEFYDYLKREGYSKQSCTLGYATVRSFFSHNNKPLEKFHKKFSGKTQYEQGHSMTQKEVFQLVEAVPKWYKKLAVAICFQAGQRRGVCTAHACMQRSTETNEKLCNPRLESKRNIILTNRLYLFASYRRKRELCLRNPNHSPIRLFQRRHPFQDSLELYKPLEIPSRSPKNLGFYSTCSTDTNAMKNYVKMF